MGVFVSQNNSRDSKQYIQEMRQVWDAAAAAFDDQPDHGLRNPRVRAAWTAQLQAWLPPCKSAVLDVGCGTGSLSQVMAELGHIVTGIDLSPAMLTRAAQKARGAGLSIDFREMNAAAPLFPPASFDVLICRHLLWALPDPAQVLQRWANLLAPSGRMILIEGYWHTGAGLHASQILTALPSSVEPFLVEALSGQPDLWGQSVTDERYAIIADLQK